MSSSEFFFFNQCLFVPQRRPAMLGAVGDTNVCRLWKPYAKDETEQG